MSNKDYLIKTLKHLINIWEPAKGLIMMVEKNQFSIQVIDSITQSIRQHIDDIDMKDEKLKLKMGIETIQLIKFKEQQNKEIDADDIQQIESLLGI